MCSCCYMYLQNFHLIDFNLVIFTIVILGRRLGWCVLQELQSHWTSEPKKSKKEISKSGVFSRWLSMLQGDVHVKRLMVVLCTLLVILWSVVRLIQHTPLFNLLFLFYPWVYHIRPCTLNIGNCISLYLKVQYISMAIGIITRLHVIVILIISIDNCIWAFNIISSQFKLHKSGKLVQECISLTNFFSLTLSTLACCCICLCLGSRWSHECTEVGLPPLRHSSSTLILEPLKDKDLDPRFSLVRQMVWWLQP